jgi:predicted DNA-binding antitoxin AbrB/MazE fold protein
MASVASQVKLRQADAFLPGWAEALRLQADLCYRRGMTVIEAEFEDGVLRPIHRLPLRSGERVGIVVVRRPDPARWDVARLAKQATDEDLQRAEEGLDAWADALDREDRR